MIGPVGTPDLKASIRHLKDSRVQGVPDRDPESPWPQPPWTVEKRSRVAGNSSSLTFQPSAQFQATPPALPSCKAARVRCPRLRVQGPQ